MIAIIVIGTSITGIVLLFIGKVPLSFTHTITGLRARIVGAILTCAFPSLYLAIAIAGVLVGFHNLSTPNYSLTQMLIALAPSLNIIRILALLVVLSLALVAAYWPPQTRSLSDTIKEVMAQLADERSFADAHPSRVRHDSIFAPEIRRFPVFLSGVAIAVMLILIGASQTNTSIKTCDNDYCVYAFKTKFAIATNTAYVETATVAYAMQNAIDATVGQVLYPSGPTSAFSASVAMDATFLGSVQPEVSTFAAHELTSGAPFFSPSQTAAAQMTVYAKTPMSAHVAQQGAQATRHALNQNQTVQLPGKLVSVKKSDGTMYTFTPAGDDMEEVIRGDKNVVDAKWSLNGKLLAIERNILGGDRIEIAPTDGSSSTFVGYGSDPNWSSDSLQLATVRHSQNGSPDPSNPGASFLYVFNVADNSYNEVFMMDGLIESPTWASDGKSIAFCLRKPNQPDTDIYLVDLVSSKAHPLTHDAHSCSPSWSPDGKRIAYLFRSASTDSGIYLMNTDGVMLKQVTHCQGGDPAWSPDSQHLIFAGGAMSECEAVDRSKEGIFVVDLNTNILRDVTPYLSYVEVVDDQGVALSSPSWGP